jgi:predicted metal-binding membrane protein
MAVDTVVETLLKRDRRVVLTILAAVTAGSWAYVLAGAGMGMSAFEMTRTSLLGSDPGGTAVGSMQLGSMGEMAMTPVAWTLGYAVLIFFMWWIMMVAMMLPSASPMILLHAAVNRKPQRQVSRRFATTAFMLGYLGVWAGFSLVATAVQWSLSRTGLFSEAMVAASALLAGFLLLAAGLYQLTPIKQACLKHCRLPAEFLATHWRPGVRGAFRMGLVHGGYCVGCCWLLMLLLFFGGVMNLYWIAGLALFILFEKTAPAGHWLGYGIGVLLAGWGAWIVAGAI